jgi:hypothetical protein
MGIKKNVERRLESLVAAQFDEPRVQQLDDSFAAIKLAAGSLV